MKTENETIDKALQEMEGEISLFLELDPEDPQLFIDLLDEVEIAGGDSIDSKEGLLSPDAKQKRILFENKDGVAGELIGGGSSAYRDVSGNSSLRDLSDAVQVLTTFPGIIELSISIGVGVASNILTTWISRLFLKFYNRFKIERVSIDIRSKKYGYMPLEIDLLFELIRELLEEKELTVEYYTDIKNDKNVKADKEKIKKLDKKLKKELEEIDDEINELLNKTINKELAKIIKKEKRKRVEINS